MKNIHIFNCIGKTIFKIEEITKIIDPQHLKFDYYGESGIRIFFTDGSFSDIIAASSQSSGYLKNIEFNN